MEPPSTALHVRLSVDSSESSLIRVARETRRGGVAIRFASLRDLPRCVRWSVPLGARERLTPRARAHAELRWRNLDRFRPRSDVSCRNTGTAAFGSQAGRQLPPASLVTLRRTNIVVVENPCRQKRSIRTLFKGAGGGASRRLRRTKPERSCERAALRFHPLVEDGFACITPFEWFSPGESASTAPRRIPTLARTWVPLARGPRSRARACLADICSPHVHFSKTSTHVSVGCRLHSSLRPMRTGERARFTTRFPLRRVPSITSSSGRAPVLGVVFPRRPKRTEPLTLRHLPPTLLLRAARRTT